MFVIIQEFTFLKGGLGALHHQYKNPSRKMVLGGQWSSINLWGTMLPREGKGRDAGGEVKEDQSPLTQFRK